MGTRKSGREISRVSERKLNYDHVKLNTESRAPGVYSTLRPKLVDVSSLRWCPGYDGNPQSHVADHVL